MGAEGGQTEVTGSVFSETGSGGAYDLGMIQQIIEKFPGFHIVWTFKPDIGGVDAAEEPDVLFAQGVCDQPGVVLVIADVFLALCHALRGKYSLGAFLDDVGGSVEFGGLAAVPHGMKGHFPAVKSREGQLLWNHGVAAAGACKACSLRKGAKFYGAFFGAFNGIDASGKLWICDKCLVGRVEQDYGLVF